MPIKRPPLINDQIYHIVVRGVSDYPIFRDKADYFRAIFSLYEFNTSKSIEISKQREKRKEYKKGGLSSDDRDFLVEILSFCFMPNHIHLLLKQIVEDGITQFMRKFGTGYASYINKKYDRKGHLFQGRFRAVHIGNDDQLKTVFAYIHVNPASLVEPKWKDKGIKNSKKVIDFLENYKWSSYQDYIGKRNFPSVTERAFLDEIMGGEVGCGKFVKDWVEYKGASHKARVKYFDDIVLE